MNARSWTLHNGATLHLSPAAYGSWFARLTFGQRSIGCVASTRREALRTVKQFYRTPETAQVSATQRHTIRLATGHLVTLTRRADGWSAQCKAVSAFGASPREALRFLRPLLVPAPSDDVTWERLLAGPYCVTVQGQSGYGLTVRDAYRAAWRALRLSRHDPADLLRQIADLRRIVNADALLIRSQDAEITNLRERLENAENTESAKHSNTRQKSPRVGALDEVIIDTLAHAGDDYDGVVETVRVRRRARHAAAIRAHRAEMTRRLHDCRRSLLDALAQRNAVASRITQMQARITEARAKSPELEHALRELTTDDIESIVERLLHLAARAAEYHRRATAAEARASELHAGQQSLLAAARAAGFEYTVSAGAARFTPVNAEATEGDAGPRALQPTGGETPTDRPQAAPDARQPA